MSSSVPSPAQLVELFRIQSVGGFARASILTLFLYDLLLNFHREVETVWRRKFQPTTAIYVLVRYFPLLGLVVPLMQSVALSPSCTSVLQTYSSLTVLARAGISAMLILQTYAICNKNRLVLLVIGSQAFGVFVIDCLNVESYQCNNNIGSATKRSDTLLRTSLFSIFMCSFSVIVLALTSFSVLRILRQVSRLKHRPSKMSLPGVIFIETLCIFGICILQLLGVITFWVDSSGIAYITLIPFVIPVEAMFVAHLIISLREIPCATEATASISAAFTTLDMANLHSRLEDYQESTIVYGQTTHESENIPCTTSKFDLESQMPSFAVDSRAHQ